jgi:hypothetical protein
VSRPVLDKLNEQGANGDSTEKKRVIPPTGEQFLI